MWCNNWVRVVVSHWSLIVLFGTVISLFTHEFQSRVINKSGKLYLVGVFFKKKRKHISSLTIEKKKRIVVICQRGCSVCDKLDFFRYCGQLSTNCCCPRVQWSFKISQWLTDRTNFNFMSWKNYYISLKEMKTFEQLKINRKVGI